MVKSLETEDYLELTTLFFSRLYKGLTLIFKKGETDGSQPSDMAHVLGLSLINVQLTGQFPSPIVDHNPLCMIFLILVSLFSPLFVVARLPQRLKSTFFERLKSTFF